MPVERWPDLSHAELDRAARTMERRLKGLYHRRAAALSRETPPRPNCPGCGAHPIYHWHNCPTPDWTAP